MTNTNLHREDIKAAIRKKGGSLAQIAREERLQKGTLTECLVRPVPSANRAIARFLNRRLNELWPEWFDVKGSRKYLKSDASSLRSVCHFKNKNAA